MNALLLASALAVSSPRYAAAVQPFVDRKVFAGGVMVVADRSRVLATETVGFADLASRRPMRADSFFWIASMTKSVTATAFMMLVDEGKVSVDDPVDKYLPEFKDPWLRVEEGGQVVLRRPKNRLLIRHLLSHSGGLPHFTKPEEPTFTRAGDMIPDPETILPLKTAAKVYAMAPLEFEPGTRWKYCNAGINTVGRIIEVVSGLSYEEFLLRRLFRPLGMRETTFTPTRSQLARLATSYRPDGKGGLTPTAVPILDPKHPGRIRPWPCGGLFSTAHDLGRFCQMVLNEGTLEGRRYLSASAVRRMATTEQQMIPEEGYGLGWGTNPDGSFGHSGAFHTIMTIDPRRNRAYILLMQQANIEGDGGQIYRAFQREVQQEADRR